MAESLPRFWSFNRLRDAALIQSEEILWQGPFSWPGYQTTNELTAVHDSAGVYLLTFEYKDGYILRSVGITNAMRRRFSEHTRAYLSGAYTVLDVNAANNGQRHEIWHGWGYAKSHKDEFLQHKDEILKAVHHELASFRVFFAEIGDRRKRERLEFAITVNAYMSREPWGDLLDGGMSLQSRCCYEMPVEVKNRCAYRIYGLPEALEI